MHRCHMAAKFSVFVDQDHSKLPTLYWLPKLHKIPFKVSKGAKIRNRYNQVPIVLLILVHAQLLGCLYF